MTTGLNKVVTYFVCWFSLWLSGNQRLQEVQNIVGSELDHWLLVQEFLDDISSFAEGTISRLAAKQSKKHLLNYFLLGIFLKQAQLKFF